MKPKRKTLYLIDGAALAYRSFFALIKNPLVNSRGLNTSAIYGFGLALLKILNEVKPDYLGVVFDSKEPTFRHEKYKDYKATREKMPDEMADQLPYIEKLVGAFSVPYITVPSYEADDIMGTLATKFAGKNLEVFLVSGDKDLMQLIDKNIKLYTPKRGGEAEIIDAQGVQKKHGVSPSQMIDLLSLMGDSSDNIPGVPGVGEKTARKLLLEFESLDKTLSNADKVDSKKISESLKNNKKLALLSKELVTIKKDVPLNIRLEDLSIKSPDHAELENLFKELELHSFLEKIKPDQKEEKRSDQYVTVNNNKLFDELFKKLSSGKVFTFDTETTSTNPLEAELVGLSFAFAEGQAFYLPFNLKDKFLSSKDLVKVLKPIFENYGIAKGGHNVKYDILVLRNAGITTESIVFDTMLESYLIDPGARQHNLDLLSLKHLSYRKIPIEDLIGKGSSKISMNDVGIQEIAVYSCEDSDMTLRLHNLLAPRLKELNLEKLYKDVELPLMSVLSDMEWEGVKIDSKLLGTISKKIGKKLETLKTDIFKKAGGNFNINSPKQLSSVLFEKLRIQNQSGKKRIKKTKTGYSTNSAVLEEYSDHPIVNNIIEYRNLSKLQSTYLDSLPGLVCKTTGRIHTSFNQTVTATGRLSSSDPNLQNIPIRTEMGREIRKAFIPRSKDWSLISADYSQIELRILAHLSKDENMIQTFRDGVDVHTRTAARIFGLPDNKIDESTRSRAKAINFGIIYGMGPQRLARETKISFEEAQTFIGSYFEKHPRVKEFIGDQIQLAIENGFVTTLLGRRRYIPDILSDNPRLKINAEHIAVNTPIQGSAADMIKVAMINIHKKLAEENLESKMILQVHDELVFESPDSEISVLMKMVKSEMEEALALDVPVRVDIKSGKSWYEAH